jgi:serine/threonine-protein kinase HipA
MRSARVFAGGIFAGVLEEAERGKKYIFRYSEEFQGQPVSLTMPTTKKEYFFESFPSFFEGVLPEGVMLDALLKQRKIDRDDLFGQLLAVGEDLVGSVSVQGEL